MNIVARFRYLISGTRRTGSSDVSVSDLPESSGERLEELQREGVHLLLVRLHGEDRQSRIAQRRHTQ